MLERVWDDLFAGLILVGIGLGLGAAAEALQKVWPFSEPWHAACVVAVVRLPSVDGNTFQEASFAVLEGIRAVPRPASFTVSAKRLPGRWAARDWINRRLAILRLTEGTHVEVRRRGNADAQGYHVAWLAWACPGEGDKVADSLHPASAIHALSDDRNPLAGPFQWHFVVFPNSSDGLDEVEAVELWEALVGDSV